MNKYHLSVNIEILDGGFVLSYPQIEDGVEHPFIAREVFTSQSKLIKKMKEVLDQLATTPEKESE